jgi:FdhE protein
LDDLARLAQEKPSLAGSAALFRDVLPILYEEPPRESPPPITPEQAVAKLAGGVPLLRGEAVALDAQALGRRWQRVCAAVHRQADGDAPAALDKAVRGGKLDLADMAREVLAGRPEGVHARADALGLDAGLTANVLRLTLFPVLAHLAAALGPLRAGTAWPGGNCPTCGSWPLLGEFRGLEQTRFLRCGLCATEWEFPRLRCPFCDNRDHQRLGYFHAEGEETRCRAATCEACRGYVKMLSTLGALAPPRLLVADLATVHLDLAAAERGYAVPTVTTGEGALNVDDDTP